MEKECFSEQVSSCFRTPVNFALCFACEQHWPVYYKFPLLACVCRCILLSEINFFRMKHYIDNGLDKKYLRDPDYGVNLMKKKAKLGMFEKAEPKLSASFPKEGFKSNLSDSPKVLFGTIWKYMIDAVDSKKKLSTAKPHGLLEMKLIQLNEGENLKQALLRKGIGIDRGNNTLKMNKNHKYFFQIQQLMFLAQRKWTDFVVKGSTGNELYIERVHFDPNFGKRCLSNFVIPFTSMFYSNYLTPV